MQCRTTDGLGQARCCQRGAAAQRRAARTSSSSKPYKPYKPWSMPRERACLEDLRAGQQEGLVGRAEAGAIRDAPLLKQPHIDAPEAEHGEHDEERLVVDVEQLRVLVLRKAQAGHDRVHRGRHAAHEGQRLRAVALRARTAACDASAPCRCRPVNPSSLEGSVPGLCHLIVLPS